MLSVNPLGFLEDFEPDGVLAYRPRSLRSKFEAPVWHWEFGAVKTAIDFRVVLDDGRWLTSRQQAKLLHRIKQFLCLQVHPYVTEGRSLSHKTERHLISSATHLIDYFLVRAPHFEIGTKGFAGVRSDDIAALIAEIGEHRRIKESLYNAEEEVTAFFRKVAVGRSRMVLTGSEPKGLLDVDVQRELDLTDDQVRFGRLYLWHHGLYRYSTSGGEAKFLVRSQALLSEIYKHRVIGNLKFDHLPLSDFVFGENEAYLREHPAVPVQPQRENQLVSEEYVTQYTKTLRSMAIAAEQGFELISPRSLSVLDNRAFLATLATKRRERFATLPFSVANDALSDALKFFLGFGDALVDSYLACARASTTLKSRLSDVKDVPAIIVRKLQKLGVRRWRLPTKDGADYFRRLRNNEGLYELLLVLYGSIVVILGSVMARRIEELLSLKADSWSASSDGWSLRFPLAKANVGPIRKVVSKPLPNIGAKTLRLLKRLHDGLAILGCDVSKKAILAVPLAARAGLAAATSKSVSACLDHFCDYFETAKDAKGRRYYLRTHQLRRNFAMLFFWHFGMGGLDVLRDFLGHVKPEHVWRYITESLQGEVLQRVKAEFGAFKVLQQAASAEPLADLLIKKFGRRKISIMPASDVADYVEDLLSDGTVRIEPVFFTTKNNRQRCKILIKVTREAKGGRTSNS